MNDRKKALKAAFPLTIPVMTGYLFLGMAYGFLMQDKGFSLIWILLNSLIVYAGSMQILGITLLAGGFDPLSVLLITLVVNARHLFYGISMLDRYKSIGRLKPYLIFGLTDETFSIVSSADAPKGVDKGWFAFFITLLNQCYWVTGTLLGGAVGNLMKFNTAGLDFALTALFVVIFLNQWTDEKDHRPALTGLGGAFLCRLAFGSENFILPAMAVILLVLTFFYFNEKKKGGKRI